MGVGWGCHCPKHTLCKCDPSGPQAVVRTEGLDRPRVSLQLHTSRLYSTIHTLRSSWDGFSNTATPESELNSPEAFGSLHRVCLSLTAGGCRLLSTSGFYSRVFTWRFEVLKSLFFFYYHFFQMSVVSFSIPVYEHLAHEFTVCQPVTVKFVSLIS